MFRRPSEAQLPHRRVVYTGAMERSTVEGELALREVEEEVRRWRREQFVLLGFNEAQALLLAASDADLAHARYLVGCGCTATLALQILL